MDDLIEFLRARLDEDEETAISGRPDMEDPTSGRWTPYTHQPGPADLYADLPVQLVGSQPNSPDRTGGMDWAVCEVGQQARAAGIGAHIARHDPARTLREVESTRQIIALCSQRLTEVGNPLADDTYFLIGGKTGPAWGAPVLRLLALPYSDHPDYRKEWRP